MKGNKGSLHKDKQFASSLSHAAFTFPYKVIASVADGDFLEM